MIVSKKTQEILAVIPARGGSKGIPRKNLAKIAGYTLVEHAIHVSLKCPLVYKTILSTDDPEIAKIGKNAGASVPFLRPHRLAGDKVRTVDVIIHLLKHLDDKPQIVLILQPTAPLRTPKQISQALQILIKHNKADAIASVVPLNEPHPMKTKVIQGGWLRPFVKKADSSTPRQLLPSAYKLNGAIYAIRVKAFLKEKTILPSKTLPFIMPAETCINIDTFLDLLILRSMIENKEKIILKYF
jgi:CMP-N,N'-diacetyllegionaminic acid synthase